MRIIHIITRLIVGGAQENTVYSVLGLLRKPGLQVQLISGPSLGPEGSLESHFDTLPGVLTVIPELVRPVRPRMDYAALRRLEALLRELRPDVVHTHSGKAGVVGRLAASRAGVPLIVHTIHGPSFGPFQGKIANVTFAAAEKYAARVTDHFVVVADAMRDQYLAQGIGRPEQYTKVLSGFHLEPFLAATNDLAFRSKLGLSAEDFVIGKLARLSPLKGHEDLVESAHGILKDCPNARFLLVGDGELRPGFESRAKELGILDRFVFTGLLRPDEVPRYLGIMNVLVHLSRREGLPRALPQALAAGKPVVAYDCDGAGEVCLHEQTGILLRAGDRPGLIKALVRLGRDPMLCGRMGARGREFVTPRFGVQRMVDDLHSLYLRLRPS